MLKNKKLRGFLQILLSLVLLTWLISRAGLGALVDTLSGLDLTWYIPAFALFLVNIVIRAYRWYILLHSLNERPSLRHLTYLYFIGFFANNFIPSGFGGDFVKIVSLRRTFGRGTEALSSVVMDRVTGLLGSALIALVALIWNSLGHVTAVELPTFLWVIIALLSIGIPVAFLFIRWSRPLDILTRRFPQIQKIPKYDKLEQLVDTVNRYPLPVLLRSLLTSLPFTLSLIVVQYFIARALGVDLPLAVFGLFVPIISILNLLPLSFNGLGVREGIYQFLFVPIGVPTVSAIAMSLAFYFLRVGTGMVGGLWYAYHSVFAMLQASREKKLSIGDKGSPLP
ncbi:MAG: lysylphosphatidylglycerol synthase transmembrane domain-containing protein [Anaerolineae bacterium]|jgi:glycosyltransferase 2 family protein